MKALTLTQPWATLVAIGAKTIETRSWRTHYRGPIAIHAAKAIPPYTHWRQFRHPAFMDALEDLTGGTGCDGRYPDLTKLPTGAVLAIATVVDVLPTLVGSSILGSALEGWSVTDEEAVFGDFAFGRYGWILENVLALPEPLPCRGFQRLWNLPVGVMSQIPWESLVPVEPFVADSLINRPPMI